MTKCDDKESTFLIAFRESLLVGRDSEEKRKMAFEQID